MNPLEKFEKISEKNNYWTSLTRRGGQRYCVDLHQEGAEIVEYDTPDEAIEAAYKKLFPPIKKNYGCWRWENGDWRTPHGDTVRVDPREVAGKRIYLFSDSRKSPTELDDFQELKAANKELKPPMEE